jgi:hypothetical protein
MTTWAGESNAIPNSFEMFPLGKYYLSAGGYQARILLLLHTTRVPSRTTLHRPRYPFVLLRSARCFLFSSPMARSILPPPPILSTGGYRSHRRPPPRAAAVCCSPRRPHPTPPLVAAALAGPLPPNSSPHAASPRPHPRSSERVIFLPAAGACPRIRVDVAPSTLNSPCYRSSALLSPCTPCYISRWRLLQ